MKSKFLILGFFVFLLLSPVFSSEKDFLTGLHFFENEDFEKAEKYFYKVTEKDKFYPYAIYYLIITQEILGKKIYIPSNLKKYKNLVIYSYINLKLSSIFFNKGNFEKSYNYLKFINEKNLKKEDIPFYLYLKSNLLEKFGQNKKSLKIKKILAIYYSYDKFYSLPVYFSIEENLKNWEKLKSIQILIKNRKFKTALFLLERLPDNEKKIYFQFYSLLKLKKLYKAEKLLNKINKNSNFYNKAIYLFVKTNYKNLNKQKKYFSLLTDKQYKEKLAFYMMKRTFFKGNYPYFFYFSSFISPDSKYYGEKIWLKFLFFYKFKNYEGCYTYLRKNKRWIYEKSKYYYWMYKLAKKLNKHREAYGYLKKLQKLKGNITFYKVLAYQELKKQKRKNIVKLVSYHIPAIKKQVELSPKLSLIKILKKQKNLYKWAFLEGKFYKNKHSLYFVMPELTAKYFLKKDYIKSYPKPFGTGFYNKYLKNKFESLVYGIMRQESFFNPFVIGYSNDVGLMQFIPSTAKWVAKELGIKDFDMSDMFIPEINIKFGKFYLDYLLDIWNGKLYYAIASYNAGPNAVKMFLNKFNGYNYTIEEFAEYFPYEVTRRYIKNVYRNFVVYNLIYKQK